MKNKISLVKIIAVVVLVLVSTSLLFYFYVSGNGSLLASNSKRIQEGKGMSIEEFNRKVSNKDKIVLVYFFADWCVPCIKLKREILALENESRDFCDILKLDVDENPIIAEHFEINTLPMFIIYKKGNKSWENIGSLTKMQIQTKLQLYK